MKKIWVIVQREYLSRVRNKTFLLSTFLFPLFLVAIIAGSAYLGAESSKDYKIGVQDATGQYAPLLKNEKKLFFETSGKYNTSNFKEHQLDGILQFYSADGIHTDSIRLYTADQGGMNLDESIIRQIEKIEQEKAMQQKGMSRIILDSITSGSKKISERLFRSYVIKGSSVREGNKGLAYAIGFGSGLLIYITLFVYGASVMRGVMEEKMNRIAEVIVSSVKPFQLMMGKIIGIAAVGLTQLLLWAILLFALSTAATYFISPDIITKGNEAMQQMPLQNGQAEMAMEVMQVQSTILSANWGVIIGCFLFYFLGGYLFYASLFAAIGSVVNEDPQEAQSLMLPITMPIIFAFVIMTSAIEQPGSSLAFWGSIIPFTSPIVMMARIPSGIPDPVAYWQLGLSMCLLIGGFLLTTWISAKIYRTGILMYGKKAGWKEMIKWAFRK
jgi:ABC-2 type transport system permease protein